MTDATPETPARRVLLDSFSRIAEVVHDTVSSLDERHLVARISPAANTIAWLVWHLARVQDDHMAGIAHRSQVWTDDGWVQRFGLPFDAEAIGYGQTTDEVAAVTATADLLIGYFDAVHARTVEILGALADADLDEVVDDSYDPPVTMQVRIVSVVSDCLQHAGQAAFVRGALDDTWSTTDG